MLYVISPGCQGPNGEALALAFVPPGWVVVQDASDVTDTLLWQTVYDAQTGGFALVSLWSIKNGQPRAISMIYGAGGKLLSMPLKQYGLDGTTLWRATSDGDTVALNSLRNAAFMNIAGDGPWPPGTSVQGTVGGYNGASNEVWTFTPAGTDSFPWTYTFAPECAPATLLSASASDPSGQLTIETPSAAGAKPGGTQLWAGTYVIEDAQVLGAAFVNDQLQMLIRTTPNTGGAVFTADLSELDQWSAWRVAAAPAAGLSAVYSAGLDDLTVNVQGAGPYGPGDAVITSKSQGEKSNEHWTITSLPQKAALDGMVSDEEYEAELKRLTAAD